MLLPGDSNVVSFRACYSFLGGDQNRPTKTGLLSSPQVGRIVNFCKRGGAPVVSLAYALRAGQAVTEDPQPGCEAAASEHATVGP